MSTIVRLRDESIEEFAERCYCVCGRDGHVDPIVLRRVVETVSSANPKFLESAEAIAPDVLGVSRLRMRVDEAAQIAPLVAKLMPTIEADPRLLALSFSDPLVLAVELGIAVSPKLARQIQRGLSTIVPFDSARGPLDPSGRGRFGITSIRWRPHPGKD
jgi:hypothetical protein